MSDGAAYHARFGGHDSISDADMENYKPKKEFVHNRNGSTTKASAAGAYQIDKNTWKEAGSALSLKSFYPSIQDQIAEYYIKRDAAQSAVREGDLIAAFAHLKKRWSSLPGGTQSHHSLDEATTRFDSYPKDEMSR